jgi:hypothetical protein
MPTLMQELADIAKLTVAPEKWLFRNFDATA